MFKIGDKVVLADKRLMWDDGSVYKEIETIEVNNIAGREVMTYKVVGKNIYYNENILELYTKEDAKEKALRERLETQKVLINQLKEDKIQLEKEKEEQQTELSILKKTISKLKVIYEDNSKFVVEVDRLRAENQKLRKVIDVVRIASDILY